MRVCALGSDNWLGTHDCDVLPEVTENCHNWYLKHALLLSLSLSLSLSLYPSRTDTAEWRKNSSVNSLSPSSFSLSSSFSLLHCSHFSFLFFFHNLLHSLSLFPSLDCARSPSLTCSLVNVTFTGGSRWICAHTHTLALGWGWGGGNVGLWGEIMRARRGRRDISRSPFFFCRLLSCNSGLCPSQQLKQKCLWTWEHWIIAPDYFFIFFTQHN